MSSIAARRFFEEMVSLIQKPVIVVTTSNKRYVGSLVGFDPESLSICLSDAKDDEGKGFPRIFINGNIIAQLFATEKPFDLKGLAERLERVFPKLVKLYEDAGVIVVMDKIRVTSDGVVEGAGPAAERAKKVYDEFMRGT